MIPTCTYYTGSTMPYSYCSLSTENISLIIKFKAKYIHRYMTASKYFYLEHISLEIIHDHSIMMEQLTMANHIIIIIGTTLWLLHTIYCITQNFALYGIILTFMQCKVQSSYSEHAHSFIYQHLQGVDLSV